MNYHDVSVLIQELQKLFQAPKEADATSVHHLLA